MSLLPYEQGLYANYTEYRVYKWLLWSVSPAVLTVGTIGNVLATWVLWQGSKRSSTFAYLLALGFADQVTLLSGLLRGWLTHLTGLNLSLHSSWLCVSGHLISTASTYLSVLLIVAVTVERAGMVQQKTVRPASASVRKARFTVAALTAACLLINSHWLFTLDLYNHVWPGTNETMLICELREKFVYLREELAWLDSTLYCFAPFSVILVCNCRIIYVLRTSAHYPSTAAGPAIELRVLRGGGGGRRSTIGNSSSVATGQLSSQASFNRNFRQVTVTLLSVSGLFLATALPITALKVATSLSNFVTVDYTDPLFHSRYLLVQACTEMLMYTNHASNFFLYCLCGKKFRRELAAKFSRLINAARRQQGRNNNSNSNINNTNNSGAIINSHNAQLRHVTEREIE